MPRYRVLVAARLSKKAPKKKRGSQEPDFADPRHGIGIEIQDAECVKWAKRQGYDVVAVVADVKKGTVAPWDRPNLREWVACGCPWCRNEDRRSGRKRPQYKPERMTEYDAILTWRNDRLSRGAWSDEARIRQWAEEHNKILMIKDGPQWPPRHPGDKSHWEAMADQARNEWEDVQRRCYAFQAELKKQGNLLADRHLVMIRWAKLTTRNWFLTNGAGGTFRKFSGA